MIAAVGEKVPTKLYESLGIAVDARGRAVVNPETMETSVKGLYVAGDGVKGPATVVEGIRDEQDRRGSHCRESFGQGR